MPRSLKCRLWGQIPTKFVWIDSGQNPAGTVLVDLNGIQELPE